MNLGSRSDLIITPNLETIKLPKSGQDMNMNSIGSDVRPYAPRANQNSDTLGKLQRQKDVLIKELEAVKAKPKNSQAEQDAAEKQKKALEEKIANIEQKIQRASLNKSGEASTASKNSDSMEANENSPLQKNSPMQTDDLAAISDQELLKKNKSPFEDKGNILNIYV